VTEIRVAGGFFDYEAKYQPGGAEEITPADISESLAREIQSWQCVPTRPSAAAPLTRTDFMMDGDQPVILEINTIPGMTRMSLIPRACAAAGIEFESILDRLIGEALFKEQIATVVT
ncbi:MAG: D-alanine--D-alanine ligase, partial [Candidatus Hinthialibacteria bacterium OLB16]